MAKAIHTVLHVPMGERSIDPCPETFGGESASRTGFNGFAPSCLRKDEGSINAEPELTSNEDLKELCARRNACGHAVEEVSMGAP